MAKKMKKMMSMVLVLCMMASMFSVSALAADETTVETETIENGGLTTEVKTTTTTEKDENGNTTVTVTVEQNTSGTNSDGATVESSETSVKTTVTDEDGEKLSETKVEEGKEVTTEVVPGDDEISVDIMENGEVSDDLTGSSDSVDPEVSGDQKKGEDDPVYNQTTVTESERTAEVIVENITTSTGTTEYVDEDGNLVKDIDNGFGYYWSDVYNIDNKSFVDGETGTAKQTVVGSVYGYIVHPDGTRTCVHTDAVCQRVVSSENGTPDDRSDDYKIGGLYCVDSSTGVNNYMEYRKANLEDSDYYSEEEASHLRAIMTYGYTWDDDDDLGETNLANIKAMLKDAQVNGDEATKELLKDMDIDNLTRKQAATATGMAVWQYGNRFELGEGDYIEFVSRDSDAANKARIETLYKYLIGLTMEADEEETQVINEEKFVDDLQMNIGGMAKNHENNSDDDATNDVYNVELKFSLVVKPSLLNDDLIVKVLDSEGNVVKTARIAGEAKEGERFGYAKTVEDENGKTYYVLEDLQLEENSGTSFDLKLEGTQALQEGIYIFESQHLTGEERVQQQIEYYRECGVLEEAAAELGGLEELETYLRNKYTGDSYDAQNFIGKFAGTAEVNVSTQIDMSFSVDEATVTTERIWRTDSEHETPNAPANNPVTPVVLDVQVHRPLTNIPDEEVPLAEAPKTGDEVVLFGMMALLAAMGLMAMQASEKKRKAEEA